MARLTLLICLLLLSLLTVVHAPAYHFWLIAVLLTEFPHVPLFISTILLVARFGASKYRLAGTIAGLAALVMFSLPMIQSGAAGAVLDERMSTAFAETDKEKSDFSVLQMLLGSAAKNKTPLSFTYAQTGLKLDFYSSVSKGRDLPCVLVIHGGSWKSGDNKQLPELNELLAAKGYHVVAINYRLAPQYQSPSQVEDVRAAITFLKMQSDRLGIDTSNLVLLGRSAGAQIALLAAYTLNDPGIKGVIDFYGPADMVWGYSVPANPLVMDSRKVMEDYLGGTYTEVPEKYSNSSPIAFVSRSSVPTLIIHGRNDPLVAYEHSIKLQNKLKEKGVKHYFLSLPWATHGFDYTINGPGGQLSSYAVERFLRSVTGKH